MGGKIAKSKGKEPSSEQGLPIGILIESLMFILINISTVILFFTKWIYYKYHGTILMKLLGIIDLHGGDSLSPFSVIAYHTNNLMEKGLSFQIYNYAVYFLLLIPLGGIVSLLFMLGNRYKMAHRIMLFTSILLITTLSITAYMLVVYKLSVKSGFLLAAVLSITGLVFSILCLPKKHKVSESRKKKRGSILGNAGEYVDTRIVLNNDDPVYFGRDASQCQVKLTGITISRKHCSIRYSRKDNCYFITDHSTNGTFYNNGQRFSYGEEVKCNSGTVIQMGEGNKFLLE
jgi:hypothetical protein